MNKILLACFICALVGCKSSKESQPPTEEVVQWQKPEPEPLEGDRTIESDIETLILDTKRNRGLKTVTLLVKNRSQRELDFSYAVEWMDRKGDIVGGFSREWIPLLLAAGASKTIEITGPSTAADSWRLHAESRPETQEPTNAE